jgi:hypothetical protein
MLGSSRFGQKPVNRLNHNEKDVEPDAHCKRPTEILRGVVNVGVVMGMRLRGHRARVLPVLRLVNLHGKSANGGVVPTLIDLLLMLCSK